MGAGLKRGVHGKEVGRKGVPVSRCQRDFNSHVGIPTRELLLFMYQENNKKYYRIVIISVNVVHEEIVSFLEVLLIGFFSLSFEK